MSRATVFAEALAGEQDEQLPNWWQRALGVRQIDRSFRDTAYRCSWGDFVKRFGFELKYSIYHEHASLVVCFIWGNFYIGVPMLITQRANTEDWNASYGISLFARALHLNWRTRCKIVHLPWDWQHVRHTFLNADGSAHHHCGRGYEAPPAATQETHPYTYVLKSGAVQRVNATVNGEEREWRWRWCTWLPLGRVERSINVAFDAEVGERTGSRKGGTLGCGYAWRHGETLEQVTVRYPDTVVGQLGPVWEQHENSLKSAPVEIDEARFTEMLDVLPPHGWHRQQSSESFKLSERTSGSITAIFCRIKDRYFEMQNHIYLTHEDILRLVLCSFPDAA